MINCTAARLPLQFPPSPSPGCLHSKGMSSGMFPIPHFMSGLQLAAECTFLEAAWQLVDPGAAKLSQQPLQALEKLAFDWIIRKEAYVGGQSAAQPEVLQARNQVCKNCQQCLLCCLPALMRCL